MHLRGQWKQLTHGSSSHLIRTGDQVIGEFRAHTMSNEQTHIEVITRDLANMNYLLWLLAWFVTWWWKREIPRLQGLPDRSHLIPPNDPPPLTIPPRTRRTSHEPPDKKAPIDDWLDWREAELARGRGRNSVSFRRVSEMEDCIYSEDQLTRRNRARQKSR